MSCSVPHVLIGTASWATRYGIANSEELKEIEIPHLVDEITKGGFAGFDVAQDYPLQSEYLAPASDLQVYSKVSHGLTFDEDRAVRESIVRDLGKMARGSLTGLATHSVEEFLSAPRRAETIMKNLKEAGLINSWGVSLYTLEECREVLKFCSPDYIQAPVSAVDMRFTKPETQDLLQESGTVLHGRSIYLQGALLMELDALPFQLQALSPAISEIRGMAYSHGVSVAHLLLKKAVNTKGMGKIVVGINSTNQLKDTFRSLTSDSIGELDLAPGSVFTDDHPVLDPRLWSM